MNGSGGHQEGYAQSEEEGDKAKLDLVFMIYFFGCIGEVVSHGSISS
jgi:hypothetical protein